MKKQIQIRIFPDGTINSETFNIKGKACDKYKQILENLLEARTVELQHTGEYYEQEEVEYVEQQEVRTEN